jgi:hypothetical protein
MADFYPVLARAVSCLPANDAQARGELYARARTMVAEQLRGRGLQRGAIDAVREQAALETAISRVEEESRGVRTRATSKAGAPRPRTNGDAVNDAPGRSKTTAESLAKILRAVQSDAQHDGTGRVPVSRQNAVNRTKALMTTEASKPLATAVNRTVEVAIDRSVAAPNSLAAMLFAIAYTTAALAFSGVTYIRCMVWIAQGIIGYPTLVIVMTITVALFIAPPVIFLRKASTLPSFGFLLRFLYSASRRVF